MRKKFAVLISGYGRGAIEIIKDYKYGLIEPELGLLMSSNNSSEALKIAKDCGIPYAILDRSSFKGKKHFEEELLDILQRHEIEYIFLAGWMHIIGNTILQNFPRKIINIHPSLLPSFKGLKPIDQALESGVKITGISTHFVDETIDEGEIIFQEAIAIEEGDDFGKLDNKIFKVGTLLTVKTINKIFQ